MVLKKENIIFKRDEKGELIPVEVEVPEFNDTIKVIPMTRGELRRLGTELDPSGNTTKDQDGEIIFKHCIDPKLTEQEVGDLKLKVATSMVLAILNASGLDLPSNKNLMTAIQDKEEELKKK